MKRIVERELLDELPPTDPRAIQSRRDLRRVNVFMGNVPAMAEMLRETFPDEPPRRLVELGAGDGTFMLHVARRLSSRWKNVEVILVDRQNLVSAKTKEDFQQLGWRAEVVCADIFDWLSSGESAGGMIANLFLHHFESEKLALLLRLASTRRKTFLACEPRRSPLGIIGTKFLRLIGCNDVTRHDALVSVRAGFRGKEISQLWPQSKSWKIAERERGLFSHTFRAARL